MSRPGATGTSPPPARARPSDPRPAASAPAWPEPGGAFAEQVAERQAQLLGPAPELLGQGGLLALGPFADFGFSVPLNAPELADAQIIEASLQPRGQAGVIRFGGLGFILLFGGGLHLFVPVFAPAATRTCLPCPEPAEDMNQDIPGDKACNKIQWSRLPFRGAYSVGI
jgi:hypothetical protein